MIYGSVCSGIEAATVAWHPLGWRASFFSEIEKFPRAVLAHHYPDVPLHGDFMTIEADHYAAVDVLVGGTPCQSFSVAGLRKGLDDPRGNLMLGFGALAKRLRPRWLVWENVPGVLSSNRGRDFGTFLGMLGELGYGFAYRVFDAQYFGVAQRRRRVFVVGYLGDWRRAAAVLFECASLSGDPAPGREAGEGAPERAKDGPGDRRWPAITAPTLNAAFGDKQGLEDQHALAGGGLFVPDYVNALTSHNGARNEVSDILNGCVVRAHSAHAFDARQSDVIQYGDKTGLIDTHGHSVAVHHAMQVRRLTPRECERLQGFPDDYTDIRPAGKPTPDGPRYKALGNSMAVPVMHWIGKRIAAVDAIP